LDGSRSAAPDQLKAMLLVTVIFGHTYAQGVADDLSKWIIYGVHMPAFLFLSGYLIKADRLVSRSFGQFLAHYARRMLIAWAVVSLIWLAWFYPDSFHSVRRFVREFALNPNFHLWYIPALFIALVFTWILSRWRAGVVALVVIAVASYFVFRSPIAPGMPFADDWDPRYLGFLVFFVLGLAARNNWVPIPPVWVRIAAIVAGATLYLAAFWTGDAWFSSTGFLILNIGIGLSLPALLERMSTPFPLVGRPLQLIGEYSLWVYLLHPFVTRLTQIDEGKWIVQRAWGVAVTLAILVASVLVILLWRFSPFSAAGRARRETER
jgi:fucose 4-O-acetylase-like acetyltransferase